MYEGNGHDHEVIYTANEVRPGLNYYQQVHFTIKPKVLERIPMNRHYWNTEDENGQFSTHWKEVDKWLHLMVKFTIEDMTST